MTDGKTSCFISYSADSDEHVEQVRALAEKLKDADIDVKFYMFSEFCDVCKDIASFMEEAVIYSDKILMICTTEYAKKANRSGYEKMIITDDLLQNCGHYNKKKIIPIRFSGENFEYLPKFMRYKKSNKKVLKKVIDFSANDSLNKIKKKIKPIIKTYTLAEFVAEPKVKRKKSIRLDLKKGITNRDELKEMINIFSGHYQHWHTHYWKLVIRAFGTIISLMALAVILPKNYDIVNVKMLILFPIASIAMAIVFFLVLKAEEAQLHNLELKIKSLLEVLSHNYTDFDPTIFTFKFIDTLNRYQMVNWVLYLLIVLGCIAVVEGILIWNGCI